MLQIYGSRLLIWKRHNRPIMLKSDRKVSHWWEMLLSTPSEQAGRLAEPTFLHCSTSVRGLHLHTIPVSTVGTRLDNSALMCLWRWRWCIVDLHGISCHKSVDRKARRKETNSSNQNGRKSVHQDWNQKDWWKMLINDVILSLPWRSKNKRCLASDSDCTVRNNLV